MTVKRIAFVVKYFPTVSETFIINQINGLIDIGYSISLYAYQNVDVSVIQESLKRHHLLDKVKYFHKPPIPKHKRLIVVLNWTMKHLLEINWRMYFKTLNVFKYGKEAYTLKLFFESQWFLLPYDFDLIHAHFGMNGNRIAYLRSLGIIPEEIKLINTFHGYDLAPNQLESYKADYYHLLWESHAFTVNTPYLESLVNVININKTPCYVLPVGLDSDVFKKTISIKDEDYFDLIFCGKLIALKAPDLAIDIVKRLHDKGETKVRLHIVGKGALSESLKEQVINYQLQEHIFFCGVQTQHELKQKFEAADAFLLPGRHEAETGRAETQGLVIQEAQAMELPVIVSDVGGMKYGLIDKKSGFVVPEDDLNGFVEVIQQLINEPKLRTKMGKAGRLLVEQRYDNKILIEQLTRIYQSVLNDD